MSLRRAHRLAHPNLPIPPTSKPTAEMAIDTSADRVYGIFAKPAPCFCSSPISHSPAANDIPS